MKYKKQLVWDDQNEKYKRYVIVKNPDGSCLAMPQEKEEKFEGCKFALANGDDLIYWKHHKLISKKTTRLMNREEYMLFIYEKAGSKMYVPLMIHIKGLHDSNEWYLAIQYLIPYDDFEEFIQEAEYCLLLEPGKYSSPKQFTIEVEDE